VRGKEGKEGARWFLPLLCARHSLVRGGGRKEGGKGGIGRSLRSWRGEERPQVSPDTVEKEGKRREAEGHPAYARLFGIKRSSPPITDDESGEGGEEKGGRECTHRFSRQVIRRKKKNEKGEGSAHLRRADVTVEREEKDKPTEFLLPHIGNGGRGRKKRGHRPPSNNSPRKGGGGRKEEDYISIRS